MSEDALSRAMRISVTHFYNGDMAGQRFLNSIRYNTGLNDAMFNVSATYDLSRPAPRK